MKGPCIPVGVDKRQTWQKSEKLMWEEERLENQALMGELNISFTGKIGPEWEGRHLLWPVGIREETGERKSLTIWRSLLYCRDYSYCSSEEDWLGEAVCWQTPWPPEPTFHGFAVQRSSCEASREVTWQRRFLLACTRVVVRTWKRDSVWLLKVALGGWEKQCMYLQVAGQGLLLGEKGFQAHGMLGSESRPCAGLEMERMGLVWASPKHRILCTSCAMKMYYSLCLSW